MNDVKKEFVYILKDCSSTVKTELSLPFSTPIEEMVHVIMLKDNLPVFKDRGILKRVFALLSYSSVCIFYRIDRELNKVYYKRGRRVLS